MYHGNYDGIYPEPSPKMEVMKELGLNPDIPTVCCVGAIRNYKGIDIAAKAVKQMHMDIQLIIAGKPHPEYEINSLIKLCGVSPRIRIIPQSLSTQEFADVLNVSEAVLLPYRTITGSGAFMSAMTLGLGVIASDLPYFREMLDGHAEVGCLFEVDNEIALANAIKEYLKIPAVRRQAAVKRIAQNYSWDKVVKPVASALRESVAKKQMSR